MRLRLNKTTSNQRKLALKTGAIFLGSERLPFTCPNQDHLHFLAGRNFDVGCARWQWPSTEVACGGLVQGLAMKIARHRGMKKAIVALARRLAVIMQRMWVDGTELRWTREKS